MKILKFAFFVFLFPVISVHAQTDPSKYYSVVKTNSIWTNSKIPVCWEQMSSEFVDEFRLVQDAVINSWERHGNVKFVGWGRCATVAQPGQGIRISIQDTTPHVKQLGRFLDGVSRGMVLNFTFANFSSSCQAFENREHCIRTIAVHEFGHALGFAHEQNRDDAPAWCREQSQGSDGDWLVTEFDLDSVMNYCNPEWNGNGELSDGDIDGIRAIYPRFQSPDIDHNSWYRIVTRLTEQCIHVQNANGARRNAMWQWECQNGDQFHFQFEKFDETYYRIRTKYGKCLHVQGGPSTEFRRPLWQWECLNGDHFLFEITQTEDGWNMIKSKSGLCFHVRNGPTTKLREPLWSWECQNRPHFYFHFEAVS